MEDMELTSAESDLNEVASISTHLEIDEQSEGNPCAPQELNVVYYAIEEALRNIANPLPRKGSFCLYAREWTGSLVKLISFDLADESLRIGAKTSRGYCKEAVYKIDQRLMAGQSRQIRFIGAGYDMSNITAYAISYGISVQCLFLETAGGCFIGSFCADWNNDDLFGSKASAVLIAAATALSNLRPNERLLCYALQSLLNASLHSSHSRLGILISDMVKEMFQNPADHPALKEWKESIAKTNPADYYFS